MSKSRKVTLIKAAVTLAVGLASALYYVFSRDFEELTQAEVYRILCDGFSLPGLFMILLGVLFAMSNLGALDSISYLLQYAVRMLLPGAFGEMQHYLDYVEEKRQKRIKGYGFLFAVGGVFMAVSFVFLALFYSVY